MPGLPDDSITLVLVGEQNVMSAGIIALIERQPGMRVLAVASNIARARALDAQPVVVVSDIELGHAYSTETVPLLREAFAEAAILILSRVDDPSVVQQALGAGAAGYLLKSGTPHDLFLAIRSVARGELYLQPSLGVKVVRTLRRSSDASSAGESQLTFTDVKILRLLARGHTNSEIAVMRDVSLRTIETQRARILRKIGGLTRADLARYAREHGLIEADE